MRILIVGPSWVGDMVMAQTLFICLKQQYPQAQIDVLAPAWTEPLLARMPEVSKAIHMPIGHGKLLLRHRWKLAQQLANDGYDQAIVLPNSFKSALIPWFAKIPLRTGWRGEARSWILNDSRVLDRKKYPRMQQRFAALAFASAVTLPSHLPNPVLNNPTEALAQLQEKFALDLSLPVLILCPGAEFGAAKKWPEQHYAEVAQASIQDGAQVWILGSANDQFSAQAIVNALPIAQQALCHNFAGKTVLGEAIDLMSLAQTVISNDSGLMHIAAALAKPLVVVYGSTSPEFTPPLSQQVKVLSLALDCQPCFKRDCPLQHLHCLTELKPAQVWTAVKEVSQ